jgi:hypothetical protein
MPQLRALAILPKVTGGLSLIFSATTAAYVCKSPKRREKFYHRLILGISLADISSSVWLAMSTWPIPSNSGALYSSGNLATCRAQGFFTQAGISSSIYNSSLSFFYLLAIKYGWREARLFHWEVVFHGVPILFGLGTAITALALDILHSANLWCWIGPNPDGSGPEVTVFRMALFYGPLWIAIIVVIINLFFVFAYVRGITLKSEEHTKRSMASLTWARYNPVRSTKEEDYIRSEDDELYRDQGFIEETKEKEDTNILVDPMQSALERTLKTSEDVDQSYSDQGFIKESPQKEDTNISVDATQSALETTLKSSEDIDRSIKEEKYIRAEDDELYRDQGFIEETPEKEDTNMSVDSMQSALHTRLRNSGDVESERRKEDTVQMLSFAKRRREVAFQCLRFSVAFFITWIPITSVRILQMVEKPVPYGLLLWGAMMTPLQGLPNFCVYLFPLVQSKLMARRKQKLALISTATNVQNVQHPAQNVLSC